MQRFKLARVALALLVCLGFAAASQVAFSQTASRVRWDIISLNGSTFIIAAGGSGSARADDASKITLTGSGTFGFGGLLFSRRDAIGGGTWATYDSSGNPTGSGTYRARHLVSFHLAPGVLPEGLIDTIGDAADARAGLMVLRIVYSDGSGGILTFGCILDGTPGTVVEGIHVTKGFADYWNREEAVFGTDANFTLFHVLPEEE